jgi:hypothetical protein
MTVPIVRTLEMDITSLISGANFSAPIGRAPFAAVVSTVEYVPATAVLASTNVANTVRTFSLYNRLGTGAGTTRLASGALTSVSASQTAFLPTGLIANVASTLPLTATTSFLTIAAGDILVWESSFSGSTGGIDPGGKVIVTLSRV